MSRGVISLRGHLLFMSHRFLQSITDWTQTAAAASNCIAAACCPHIMQSSPGPRRQQQPSAEFPRVCVSSPRQERPSWASSQQPGPACSLLPTRRQRALILLQLMSCRLHVTRRPTRLPPCLEPAPASLHCSTSIALSRQCQWERCPSVRWRGPAWAQQPGWLNSELRSLYCCSPLVTSLDASEGWETHSETKLILCLPLLLPLLYKHWFFYRGCVLVR